MTDREQPRPVPTRQGDGEGERQPLDRTMPSGMAAAAPDPGTARPRTATVHAVWAGEHRFDSGRPGGPTARLDGDATTGQSPMDALLSSLAACSGIDVVDILAKRRTPVARLEIRIVGTRREEMPRRFTHIGVEYHVDGEGIGAEHAERAVALAFEKYCSAAASIAPDIVVETTLVLNGERRAPVRQRLGS